jgi:Trk-type K+ transport system membrane component
MSLVDQSMVPFQKAYAMIFPMVFLVMAGNTAFVRLFLYSSFSAHG